MPVIQVLSEQTINQIAAGEVIENPASVVKELVENALDAGARHICIEVTGGGFQKITVSDNGCGMSHQDALLCLERHATSKITDSKDLFSLTTMGFRGEALATIVAISKTTLVTALKNESAVKLEVEGGKIIRCGPAARSHGTTIEVRSLFYNVPARKKFQKSPSSSSAEITKILTHLALAHPQVSFELYHSHLKVEGAEGDFLTILQKRAEILLGKEWMSTCKPVHVKEEGFEIKGFLADPQASRPNRSGQYLFVNQRSVISPAISYAVRDAYGTRLGSDRHPLYLLHLFLDPAKVDVNVHPQKKEIRLRDESFLKHALHSAVNSALGGISPTIERADTHFSNFFSEPTTVFSAPLLFKEETVEENYSFNLNVPLHIIGLYDNYLLIDVSSLPQFAGASGMAWIHLPRAQARLEFEKLLENADTTPLSQGLLLGLTLFFSPSEMQFLHMQQPYLHQLGLQMHPISEQAFLVDALPPFLKENAVANFLHEILEDRQNLAQETLQKLAVKLCQEKWFRRSYALDEARQIVQSLLHCKDPNHCPRGKKIIHPIMEEEIERYFSK